MAEVTPMMQQYLETKKDYQDCILFYRLGDFYEMFYEDALVASKELEKKLRQAVEDCHQILGEEHDAGRYLPADS